MIVTFDHKTFTKTERVLVPLGPGYSCYAKRIEGARDTDPARFPRSARGFGVKQLERRDQLRWR
jgi:hypothetical protein